MSINVHEIVCESSNPPCKTNFVKNNCLKQAIESFETQPTAKDIAERVVSILKSYKKKQNNRTFNQNKHLKNWQEYAKLVFKQANIPQKYYYFLIKITEENMKKKENYVKNVLIKAIKSYDKKYGKAGKINN